ncbi:beta-1,3-galactosyltransferase 1-like isoform X1 [Dermacentor albipictus]|uniref:beta-1,3-galactosyltransferase 1-like isoform X1 n=2 Tax=Dermacentor albipictus TaxID=60249 RepID=UPI0031FBA5C0
MARARRRHSARSAAGADDDDDDLKRTEIMAFRRLPRWLSKLQTYAILAGCLALLILFRSFRTEDQEGDREIVDEDLFIAPQHFKDLAENEVVVHEELDALPEERVSSENPYVHPYVIDASHLCRSFEDVPRRLIFVASAPSHREARNAIRDTWGLHSYVANRNGKVLFLLGRSAYDMEIKAESQVNGDIVQGNFTDSYNNLTLKSVMMLHWTRSFCPNVEHVMKTDDDVYVNLDNLVHHLEQEMADQRRWIQGCVKRHAATPLRSAGAGQPLSPVDVGTLPKAHPDFVAGAGYVISGDLVEDLLVASARVKWVPVEDVFVTGRCAALAGVKPETDDRFSCGRPVKEPCEMAHAFTGHGMTPELMRRTWDAMLSGCS